MYLKQSIECESQKTVRKSVRIMCVATNGNQTGPIFAFSANDAFHSVSLRLVNEASHSAGSGWYTVCHLRSG